MPKIHYWHLHGALCNSKIPESSLTKYVGFVTCKNCLWIMGPIMDRLKKGEDAVARTYSRHSIIIKRAILEFKISPPVRGWPTINQLSDYLGISAVRVFDICDTEQGIKLDKVSDQNGVLFEQTRARVVQNETGGIT